MALTLKHGPEVGSIAEVRKLTENVRPKSMGLFWAEPEKASDFSWLWGGRY